MRGVISVPASSDKEMLAKVFKFLALAGGRKVEAAEIAQRAGAASRVLRFIDDLPVLMKVFTKAAVPGLATSDADLDALANAKVVSTAFIPPLRSVSAFYRAVAESLLIEVPLRTRLSSLTLGATAFITGEGAAVPLSRVKFDGVTLDVLKACAIIVILKEMLRSMGPLADAFLVRQLARSIGQCVDKEFFNIVIDGSTPTGSSSGDDEDDMMNDLKALISAVELTAESKPMFVMAPDVGISAACMLGRDGRVFPDMTPTGGKMLGIDAMVVGTGEQSTNPLAPGEFVLVDFAGIAGAAELIVPDVSDETSLQMSDAPTSDTPTPTMTTSLVSMFQTHSVANKAVAFWGAARLRDNAVAKLTGVQWGGEAGTF